MPALIDMLPNDVLLYILQHFLTDNERLRIPLVCRFWRRFAKDNLFLNCYKFKRDEKSKIAKPVCINLPGQAGRLNQILRSFKSVHCIDLHDFLVPDFDILQTILKNLPCTPKTLKLPDSFDIYLRVLPLVIMDHTIDNLLALNIDTISISNFGQPGEFSTIRKKPDLTSLD